MTLQSLLKDMEINKVNAEMDVTLGRPETYGGRVGVKRAATEALKRLRVQYRNELLSTTAFIVVTGSLSDQFASMATNDTFGCFSCDPEALYKEMANNVDKSLFGRENTKNLFNIVSVILENKALELDINSYPNLAFSDRYNSSVKNTEDLAALIKKAVNDQVGSEIVGIYSIRSIVDNAIEKNHSSSVTPIVLSTFDESFALDLQKNLCRLTSKVFLVTAGKVSKELHKNAESLLVKTVTEESVNNVLSVIRNKVL